jgi:hypothetical protein
MQNAPLRHQMGKKGQALVAGKFSWQSFQINYEKLVMAANNK